MIKNQKIDVIGTAVTVYTDKNMDFISLTDMLKAKDGDFFISDWLRNRNTVEFLGIWEKVHNPDFNYGEYAIIRNQAGFVSNRKIDVTEPYSNPANAFADRRQEYKKAGRRY